MMNEEYGSLEDLQRALNEHMEVVNAAPRPEMDNLSPREMHLLLYQTFDNGSPVAYRTEISNRVIEKIPFFRLFMIFLNKVNAAGELKLTVKGFLPVKVCKELYDTRILTEEMIESGIVKLYKETDSIMLQNLRILALLSGILKKRNNKLSFTKAWEKIYRKGDQLALMKTLFETNLRKFNLGYHDLFPQQAPIQFLITYTFYLLLRYGQEPCDLDFYIDKNVQAFPQVLEHFDSDWTTPLKHYRLAYHTRVFDRFLAHYGFVVLEKTRIPNSLDAQIVVRTTDLFREVFELKLQQ